MLLKCIERLYDSGVMNVTDEQAKSIFAANVLRILEKKNWSGRELARRTGDNPVTISRLLKGENVPGLGVCTRVAAVLDTSVDFLLRAVPEESLISA